MSKIYNGIEAKSVYDYAYKWAMGEIKQNYEIFADEVLDIDELIPLKAIIHDGFFEYQDEAEEFANIFKDDEDLDENFRDFFTQMCGRIYENQPPNGFLVSFINNLTFKRAVEIIDKISFYYNGWDITAICYNGKEHMKLRSFTDEYEKLPQYKQDICHSIGSMRCSVKEAINYTMNLFFEDLINDIDICLIGFKEVFGDDVEHLYLTDADIIYATIFAIDKKMLNCSLSDGGKELAKLVYQQGIDFMFKNDNKHPVDIESFDIVNEISALYENNQNQTKKRKDRI